MERFAFILGSDMHQSLPERGIFLSIEKNVLLCFEQGIMLVLYFMLFVLSELLKINKLKSAYSSCNLVNSVLYVSATPLNGSCVCV